MTESYKEYRQRLQEEQNGLSREEILEQLKATAEFVADINNLKPQNHRWIDRGKVMSCEGAGHPFHQAFKR